MEEEKKKTIIERIKESMMFSNNISMKPRIIYLTRETYNDLKRDMVFIANDMKINMLLGMDIIIVDDFDIVSTNKYGQLQFILKMEEIKGFKRIWLRIKQEWYIATMQLDKLIVINKIFNYKQSKWIEKNI